MKHLLLPVLLVAGSAHAQEMLEEINVTTGIEGERPLWKEQDNTKVLTGKKNRSTKVDYLPPVQTDNNRQAFSQQPSIYATEQTTEPWTQMNYRGIGDPHEAQNLLILQDGLPVAVDIYGQPGNYYSPPAALMEELQVLAGGGALMYGPQPGGAINYVTPRLYKNMETHGRVNVAGGSYNLLSTVNSITGSQGNTSYYAGYFRKQGDGYQRDNADFHADYVQLKTNTFLEGNTVLKFGFQGYDSDFGMPGGMSLEEGPGLNTWSEDNRTATKEHDRLRIARAQLNVGLEKKLSEATLLDVQLWTTAYRRYNKSQTGGGFGGFATSNTNSIRNVNAYGFNGEARVKHEYQNWGDRHVLSAGYTSYNTNSPTVAERGTAASNHGDVTTRNDRTTRVQAVYAENKFTFGKFSLVPGVRYENITLHSESFDKASGETSKASETYNVVLGGLGASYNISDSMQAFANVSQGFKPVSFGNVLQLNDPNVEVKGDIDPSYSYFYEAGLRGESRKILWDASLFLIHRQNIIATSGNEISNGRSAQYRGVESAVTFKDVLNGKNAHVFDVYVNGIFNNAQYRGGDFKGKTPAYVPSVLLKYGLVYRMENKLHASLLGTYVNEHFADDGHSDDFKIPSYMVYDLLAEYNISDRWSVNGAINNLLDEHYYARVMSSGVQPTMGRNFYAGLNYRF